MISFDEIQSILKQKSPFIFVDRVIEHEKGKRIVSIKNVTGSEMFSSFHFPDNSVYPGIFIIESIAQTASILCSLAYENEPSNQQMQFLALGGMKRVNFYKPVRPGDTMRIEVEAVKLYQQMAIVKACVKVDDALIVEGQLIFGAVKNE